LIDEFEAGHPFLEQVNLVNNSVNDVLRSRARYEGDRMPNRDPNEAYWDGFRSMSLDPATLPTVTLESGTYRQVPSRFARRPNEISVYSQNIQHPDHVDNADGGPSDARYGALSQAQMEARIIAQRARQDRDWLRSGDPAQDHNRNYQPNTRRPRQPAFPWVRVEGRQPTVGMARSGLRTSTGQGASQQPNLAALSNSQMTPAIGNGGSRQPVARHPSEILARHSATRQGLAPHFRGGRHSNQPGGRQNRQNRQCAQHTNQELATSPTNHRDNMMIPNQHAASPAAMTAFAQPARRVIPLDIGRNQQGGYLVPLSFMAHANEWAGNSYLMPVTAESLQQQGYSFTTDQSHSGPVSQYAPLGSQSDIPLTMGRSRSLAPQGILPLAMDGNSLRDTQTNRPSNARRNRRLGQEGNLPLNMEANQHGQIPPHYVQSQSGHGITRRSVATRESDNSTRLPGPRDPNHMYNRSGQNHGRASAAIRIATDRDPPLSHTIGQPHPLAPAPRYPARRPRLALHYLSDYAGLDREHGVALDEENLLSARYIGPISREGDSRSHNSELQGILRRKREVDAYRQNLEDAPMRAPRGADGRADSRYAVTSNSGSPREYLGYTIFGQRPGEVSRQPTPEISPIVRAGRRLYERHRSAPSASRNATFESRRSSADPQINVKSNGRGRNKGQK
jgi:hypothetical protein